jgi:hypothetical protein
LIKSSHDGLFSNVFYIQAVFKKNGPGYNFAIDNSNEKNYTGNEMTKNTTNLSEHIIFIPSTHLWAMGNFYFSNSNGIKNYTL